MTDDELLLEACKRGRLAEVETLLARGVRIDVQGSEGDAPLHAAARKGHGAVVECLLKHGADVESREKYNWVALHIAAAFGHLQVVKCLLANGADPNAKFQGGTALHRAAAGGFLPIVERLLASGADKDALDNESNTPLHDAASCSGQGEVIEYLLARGARPDVRNKQGKTFAELLPKDTGGYAYEKKLRAAIQGRRPAVPLQEQPGVRVYDLRSEQVRQNEQDGRSGKDVPPEADELYPLLVEARVWGRAHDWPHHNEYPQRQKVREVGERINTAFGFDGMQKVAYYIAAKDGDLTSHLEQLWNGVGSWRA
jgi:ankyrin repeat protein